MSDTLFFATVGGQLPGLTSGFTGVLTPSGRAKAAFLIPGFVPRGTRFTVAAVALNPTQAFGLDLGGTMSLVVQ